MAGDSIDDEDTVMEDPVKPMKPETVWSNSGSEANDDEVKIVKDHGVRFIKGLGFDDSEDTVEINEEEIVKQDFALINWEDAKKEETLSLVTENVLKADTELQFVFGSI